MNFYTSHVKPNSYKTDYSQIGQIGKLQMTNVPHKKVGKRKLYKQLYKRPRRDYLYINPEQKKNQVKLLETEN